MVKIDTRLLIQRKAEELIIEQELRPHLGASVLGKKCAREIWLGFRWARRNDIPNQLYRLFNRGHMEELVIAKDLIQAGCKVNNLAIDESVRILFRITLGIELPEIEQIHKTFAFGHGGASIDFSILNLIDAPKTEHLVECKTANERNFEQILHNGVEKGKWPHYVQMNIYMYLFGFKRGLYVVTNKNTDRRHYERIKLDKGVAKEYIQRGEQIVQMDCAPALYSEDRANFICRYCDFNAVCFDNVQILKTCRTCKHVSIRNDGVWFCQKTNKKRSPKKQVKACQKYQIQPI